VPVPLGAAGTKALSEALALIPPTLGPGQVLAPGRSDAESHAALLAHCAGTATAGVNRIALLDGAEQDSETLLKSEAAALRGSLQDRYGALWAPWATIPGLAPGTSRVVPWSAIQAGICARVDAAGNPNQAAAGPWGVSSYATGLVNPFTDAQRESLLLAGVNTARSVYGAIESYAFRTLVDPNGPRSAWTQLNHARLNMAIAAKSDAVGEEIIFSQIDGKGHTIAKFNGMLAGMLKELYDEGAIYGDEPAEAFQVNTGPAVNTPATLEAGTLKAILAVRMSPHDELVLIEIVKVPITVALAA
jgi:phage tail sheath protein FI